VRRRHAVARRVFALAAMASLLTATACARGKESGDSVPADSTAAASRALVGTGAPAQPSLPGALEKPLAQYTADEFFAFTHGLAFGGGIDKPRKCKASTGCEVRGGKLTSARVDAVDGQDSLSATVVPPNGVVAVRARNTGAYEEARYGLRAGAEYEYYVVVLPDTGGTARWSMQQLVTTAGARALTEVGQGTFRACPHVSKGSYRANFHTCEDAHLADSVVKMRLLLQEAISDPIWVKCGSGCCEVQ
jgi:hypothetical protein